MPWKGPKYTILVCGTDFAINNFLKALCKRFPYAIADTESIERVPGRYQAQIIFANHVLDEELKKFLGHTQPYVKEFSVDPVKVGICSCDEIIRS